MPPTPVTDTLAGTGLAEHLAGDGGQYFATFADGHRRQLPRLTSGPFRYKTYAADTLKKSIGLASKPMKQAVIAPSMLALLYPLDEQMPGYPRENFEEDLVNECEKDIRQAFEAGAARVSSTSPRGGWPPRDDPRNPWTGAICCRTSSSSTTGSWTASPPEERAKIGIHTCPGGDRDSVHSADVDLQRPAAEHVPDERRLLPDPARQRAGPGPCLRPDRPAPERGRERCAAVRLHRRDQPAEPAAGEPRGGRDALVRASNFVPRERLGSTDDCGFSPFSIDEKPNHGSPDYARDVAFQKITNRVEDELAAEKLGVS